VFFVRVGPAELLVIAGLFVALILIPFLLYLKSVRMGPRK
jgi:hypothetical protein